MRARGVVQHVWALIVLALSLACHEAPPPVVDAAVDAPWVQGSIMVTVGDTPGLEFTQLTGVALLRGGRVVVGDGGQVGKNIYLFDENGRLLDTGPGEGSGPGEFLNVCCIGADDSLIWVADAMRIHHYVMQDDALSFVQTTVHDRPWSRPSALVQLPNGRFRTHLWGPPRAVADTDSAGTVHIAFLLPTLDSMPGVGPVTFPFRRDSITLEIPHRSRMITALAPDGRVAIGLSADYHVSEYGWDGVIQRVLSRPMRRLALNAEELAEVERGLAFLHRVAEANNVRFNDRLVAPQYVPAVAGIWYDRDGRLWIEWQRPSADWRTADVYGAGDSILMQATWPSHVDLSYGAVSGTTGWGVSRDSMGVHRLVRVDFH